jgi:hypothetical protein
VAIVRAEIKRATKQVYLSRFRSTVASGGKSAVVVVVVVKRRKAARDKSTYNKQRQLVERHHNRNERVELNQRLVESPRKPRKPGRQKGK